MLNYEPIAADAVDRTGLNKIKCVALWCALAYNLTHFSKALLS